VTGLLGISGWVLALVVLFELRRRSWLLRDAAHELRGPLTAMSLGLEALRRQPPARRRAEALMNELGRAVAATDDVSAAARGRRAAPVPEIIRLDHLVGLSGEAWAPVAQRAGGSLLFDWPAGAVPVKADRRRLAQAFGNLLANAVEHGGGEIVVRGRPVGDAIRVEVSDSGAGPALPRRRRSSGRGLVIAERALKQAGGRLEARERPGGGRVAVAELPLEPAPPLDPAA
jgi:signal transduction histidine kinase